jgi:hypothetical protein
VLRRDTLELRFSLQRTTPKQGIRAGARRPQPQVGASVAQRSRTKLGRCALHRIRDTQASDAFVALFTFQTAHLVPAARFPRPGFATLLRQPESRGGRSAERRSGAAAPVGRAILRHKTRVNALMTRHARRLRGALRPMTRRTAVGNNVTISTLVVASVPIVSQTAIPAVLRALESDDMPGIDVG